MYLRLCNRKVKGAASAGRAEDMKGSKRIGKQGIALIIIFALCAAFNILAWVCRPFCDLYAARVFPLINGSFGRLAALLPFSLGEVMIGAAVFGLPLSLIAMILLLILKKDSRRRTGKIFGLTYLWIIAFIAVTETFNCFIMYHCSLFGQLYSIPSEEYRTEQLVELCGWLTERTNELSAQMERDGEGKFVLTADLDKTARESMQSLGEEFDRLGGWYTTPKAVGYSYFMSQQYLMGIYFPFSLEANYNDEMYPSNLPETVCHELAHTKGFMLEDEANFIAFLACVRSENAQYRYSGYLSALKYVLGQIRDNCDEQTVDKVYSALAPGVIVDINENAAYWQEVQESDEGVIDSKTVAEVSDKAMEASLKLNGVEDGKKSYGRMVDLLLNYYYSRGLGEDVGKGE